MGFGHLQRRSHSILGSCSGALLPFKSVLKVQSLTVPTALDSCWICSWVSALAALGLSACFSPRAISGLAVHKVI